MIVVLTILSGSREGARLVIKPGETCVVGRSSAAQFSFGDDDHMSGLHMEISNFGDHAIVRDRKSTNRTWLNKAETVKAELKHGDRLRAGKTVFFVELQDTAQPRVIEASPIVADPIISKSQADDAPLVTPHTSPSTKPPMVEAHDQEAPKFIIGERPTHRLEQGEQDASPKSSGLQLPSAAYLLINGLNGDRLRLFAQEAGACTNDNLRASLESLREFKQVRVIAHFAKLGVPNPMPLSTVTPLLPQIPQAAQHLPVILSWGAWEHATVVGITPKLLLHDALMVIVTDHDTDIEAAILSVGEHGLPGFSMASGFLNWYWPSSLIALAAMASLHGLEQALGDKIQAVVFPDPAFPARLLGLVDFNQPEIIEALGLLPNSSEK